MRAGGRGRWGVVVILLLVVAAGLVWWGGARLLQAREFGRPYEVQTPTGTNYVVRVADVTVGRTDSGYVVLVGVRVENPNPFPLLLERRSFVLVDHDKDYYLPSMTGTQTETFTMPAQGDSGKQQLSFTVPEDTLAGILAVQIGRYYWLQVKDDAPFQRALRSGEFVSFRRRHWE